MDTVDDMRTEVAHLHTLATMTTDGAVLAEIQMLIDELERRIRRGGNGHANGWLVPTGTPSVVWLVDAAHA
jgi:hypothetical protein